MSAMLTQDYTAYRHGRTFRVRGQVDGTEIMSSDSAYAAIQRGLDHLAEEGGGELRLSASVLGAELTSELSSFGVHRRRDSVFGHGVVTNTEGSVSLTV